MKKTALTFITILMMAIPGMALGVQNLSLNEGAPQNGPKYGKDSASCVVNISLYREFYKQWKNSDYKADRAVVDAIKPWKWVFKNCPLGTQNTYIDGINIMEYRIKKEQDIEMKERLIDTLLMVYDQRIEYFGNEGYVLGRKGVDMYQLRPSAYDEVYSILKRSVDLEGNKTASAILVYYFRTALEKLDKGNLEMTEVLDVYNQIEGICQHHIQSGSKKAENYANAWSNIELSGETVFSCDDLVPNLEKKFSESPDDLILIKKITELLDKKGCTDSELFFNASIKLFHLEPSPESAFMIGKMYYKRGEYAKSAQYLNQATGMTDNNNLADNYLLLATTQLHLKQYSNGRTAALNAAKYRPNDGRPYLIIGDMYVASAGECGDNKLTKKVAFWAAIDKYYKAKSIDSSIEDEANQKIATYSAYFPPVEDIFFFELQEGQAYTVGCWINETTTVRAVK